jgi:hypothetical protein
MPLVVVDQLFTLGLARAGELEGEAHFLIDCWSSCRYARIADALYGDVRAH